MRASVSSPQVSAFGDITFRERRGTARSREDLREVRQQGVMRSIEFMVRHQDEPMQVARLATVASISLSHYFAVFKEVTGFTPMGYFTRLRMRQARKLLDDTSMSVKEVAASLGYDDPFYFSRMFKVFHRIAPSEYRLLPPQLKANPEDTDAKLADKTAMAGLRSGLTADNESPEEAVPTLTRHCWIAESA